MDDSDLNDAFSYLSESVVAPFYSLRLKQLGELKLRDILRFKNPYLFKAKNITLVQDLIKSVIDAYLSSQEETMFGNLLERFPIHIAERLYGGFKSKRKSLDLEFQRDEIYYIVGIKSGTNWGNADQITTMKNNFQAAREALREEGVTIPIIAINGCMYGTDSKPLKDTTHIKGSQRIAQDAGKIYYKYAGQDFWTFITQDEDFYRKIIVPIDQEAKEKDETFKTAYATKINEMTREFIQDFTTSDQIDWIKLVDFVSRRKPTKQ